MSGSPQPVYVSLDLQSIALLGLLPEPRTTDPAGPALGRVWTRTDLKQISFYDGTAVRRLVSSGLIADVDVAAGAAIAESKLALASDAAAGVASRRTLGTGAQQAFPGTGRLDQLGAPTAVVSMGNQRLTNLSDPSSGSDAATQQWVQNLVNAQVNNQDWKASVRVATTAAIALSGTQTIDGVAVVAGDRVLVKDGSTTRAGTSSIDNGIYVVAAGAWSRAADADATGEVTGGMTVPVEAGGAANGGSVWMLNQTGGITVGTTGVGPFIQIGAAGASYSAGAGLTLTGNVFSLSVPVSIALGGTGATTAAGARSNLNVPQRGTSLAVPTLVAGTEASVAHGMGTANMTLHCKRVSDGAQAVIGLRNDATNVYVTADVAVPSGTLVVIVEPADG